MVEPSPLTEAHVRKLRRLAMVVLVTVPLLLAAFAVGAYLTRWEVAQAARASAVCVMLVLAIVIFAPLFVGDPGPARSRGFVIFWFCLSTFFNLTWQLPLILFRETITRAEPTHANLCKFIAWWGYGFADAHYGQVSSWMIAEELWWLLAILLSVVGLVQLRRGREPRAFVLLGVAGALEAYNASLYMVVTAVVDRFASITAGSVLSQILYWGFNPLWTIAALLASIFSFRIVLAGAAR